MDKLIIKEVPGENKITTSNNTFRIIKQPNWSIWMYEEVYEFEIPLSLELLELIKRIIAYYSIIGVKDLHFDGNIILFSRGSTIGSLFKGTEVDHKQTCKIVINSFNNKYVIKCIFNCFDPYPEYHINPRELERESRSLQEYLISNNYLKPQRCLISKKVDNYLSVLIPSSIVTGILLLFTLILLELSIVSLPSLIVLLFYWYKYYKFKIEIENNRA